MANDDIPLTPIPTRQAAPPQQIILQQPPSAFGRFGKWLLAALALAVMFIIGLYSSYHSYFTPTHAPIEKYHSLSRTAMQKIAIIDISGAIMDGENSFAKKQIDRVKEDTSVVGVVVRINSPGGTVTGSDYIYHHLRELKAERGKEEPFPIVVSMGSICASGGYYVAMAVGGRGDRRAHLRDRLDRRDHPALRFVGNNQGAGRGGRFDRQWPAQADGISHQEDE